MIKAPSFDKRWTAFAKDKETVGDKPSGIKATTMPNAVTNWLRYKVGELNWLFANPLIKIPRTKTTAPIDKAIIAIVLVIFSTSNSNGDFLSSICWVNEAILPNSVFIPVAKTTQRAVPVETLVPA